MASRAYYLEQAKSYFDMATMTRDQAARGRWIERANESLILADALGEDEPPLPAVPPTSHPQAQSDAAATRAANSETNC